MAGALWQNGNHGNIVVFFLVHQEAHEADSSRPRWGSFWSLGEGGARKVFPLQSLPGPRALTVHLGRHYFSPFFAHVLSICWWLSLETIVTAGFCWWPFGFHRFFYTDWDLAALYSFSSPYLGLAFFLSPSPFSFKIHILLRRKGHFIVFEHQHLGQCMLTAGGGFRGLCSHTRRVPAYPILPSPFCAFHPVSPTRTCDVSVLK